MTSDPAAIKVKREKELRGREKFMDALKSLLSSSQGRCFVWDILSRSGVYTQSAEASGSWTYFNEGKRSIGLQLLSEIMEADDEKYLVMIRENKEGV